MGVTTSIHRSNLNGYTFITDLLVPRMTFIRLLRRFLVCLLIGVIVFGVSGWFLHPAPLWVVDYTGQPGALKLVEPEHAVAADAPLWIRSETDRQNETGDPIAALDPRTGAELHGWRLTYSESCHNLFIGGDGRLIATSSGVGTTRWRVFDGLTGEVVEREHPNGWELGGGRGMTPWRCEEQLASFRLHILDLWSEKIKLVDFKTPHRCVLGKYPWGALSPDRKRFITVAGRLEDGTALGSLQIWDVDKRALLQEVRVPAPDPAKAVIGSSRWSDDGKHIELKVRSWSNATDPVQLQTAWKYDPETKQFTETIDGPPSAGEYAVPLTTARLSANHEERAVAMVPDALRSFFPNSLGWTYEERLRWLDAGSSENRDVGCRFFDKPPAVRPNAVFVACNTPEGRKTVECWPLPPRDPKRGAAAIAALSSAAAWIFFARRAARREKTLASQ